MADNFRGLTTGATLGRELPFSQEAEEAVLGGVLRDPSVLPKVIEILKPESFYRPQHQQLFTIIVRMFTTGSKEDLITVINEAVTMGVFETSAMAKNYLLGIMEMVPSTDNIESYCKIIEEKARVRSLINAANQILEKAYDGGEDSQTQLDAAEQSIFEIRQGRDVQGLTRISDVIVDTFEHLQEISGPDAGEHLGAKTCKATKRDVVIFSLEMGKEQLVSRMLASEALVNNTLLRSGNLEPSDWEKIAGAADTLSQLPIYFDDGAGCTVPQMKAKLRRMRNLGLVVIDYIQLMQSANKNASRVEAVSEITRSLKLMAKELNVPVIALSQLSRSSEKRDDKRPILSDLRESGSIEQDADIIMFLYRDAYYSDEGDKSVAECIVAKNRHGQTDKVQLGWIGEYTLFRGLDFRRDDE